MKNARRSKVDEVVVVLGANTGKFREEIESLGARVVKNPNYNAGQSTSLKAALSQIGAGTRAVVVLLGDQPFASERIINAIVDRYLETGCSIVVPIYEGQRGNPVLFDKALFPEMLAVMGDKGARDIIERHQADIATVEIESALAAKDIDNWDSYLAICSYVEAMGGLASLIKSK